MIKKRKYGGLAVAVVLLATVAALSVSCRGHKHLQRGDNDSVVVVDDTPKPPAAPVERLDTLQNAYYKYYSANFSCEVDGITVNGQIRIVHDSAIWISLNKIIEVGRVLITPTRVQGYVKLMNKYIDDDYATLAQQWGVDADYATLEALLTGNCPPHCVKRAEPTRDGNRVTLQYNQKSNATAQQRQLTLFKNYKTKKIEQTQIVSPNQRQELTCGYSGHRSLNGQLLPSVIALTVKSRVYNGATQLKLEKITLNQRQNLPFSIPKRYKKM